MVAVLSHSIWMSRIVNEETCNIRFMDAALKRKLDGFA